MEEGFTSFIDGLSLLPLYFHSECGCGDNICFKQFPPGLVITIRLMEDNGRLKTTKRRGKTGGIKARIQNDTAEVNITLYFPMTKAKVALEFTLTKIKVITKFSFINVKAIIELPITELPTVGLQITKVKVTLSITNINSPQNHDQGQSHYKTFHDQGKSHHRNYT